MRICKMKNYLAAIIVLLFLVPETKLNAQQQFGISMDRLNLPLLNPAAVDFDFLISNFNYKVSTTYRGSWSAIEGSPVTMVVRGESITARDHVSLFYGAQVYTDEIGRFRNNNFSGKFAAIFSDKLNERGLSVGLSAQLNQYKIDINNITPENYNKLVGYVDETEFNRPGVGFGVFYYEKRGNDRIYTGLSSPLLISVGSGRDDAIYKNSLHLFYNAGYIKDLQDDYSYLEFSSLSKFETTGKIFVSDFRTRYNYRNLFNVMAGYNTENFILFGFGIKKFVGQYGDDLLFDFNYTGSINLGSEVFNYFGILHELNLSFSFGG